MGIIIRALIASRGEPELSVVGKLKIRTSHGYPRTRGHFRAWYEFRTFRPRKGADGHAVANIRARVIKRLKGGGHALLVWKDGFYNAHLAGRETPCSTSRGLSPVDQRHFPCRFDFGADPFPTLPSRGGSGDDSGAEGFDVVLGSDLLCTPPPPLVRPPVRLLLSSFFPSS